MAPISTSQFAPLDLATLTPDQLSELFLHQPDYMSAVASHFGFSSFENLIAYAKGRPRRENGGFVVTDTPGLTREQALNERAAIHGMPPLGTTITSEYGTEWEIADYGFFATPTTFARYPNDCDYLPILFPRNFSQRLRNFLSEVDRCTSKQILFVDIMPSVHPFNLGEDIHCANFNANPDESVIYLDVKHAHETTIAHELAHLWMVYVEGDQDHRTLRDRSNSGMVNQFDFVHSFVIDLKVNDLIAERGFDMSLINRDQVDRLTLLRDLFIIGYQPPTPREALLHSLSIAAAILEQKRWPDDMKQRLSDLLGFFEAATPKIYQTAQDLVQIVREHGYDSREATRKVLDECITLGFRATGDDFDVERDLKDVTLTECMQDKDPEFLPGCPVQLKLEIGKTLARNAISGAVKVLLSMSPVGMAQIMVETENGERIGPFAVSYVLVPFASIANVDPMKLMRLQNGNETADEMYERINGRKRPNPFGGVH